MAIQFLPSDRPRLNLERNKQMLIQVIKLTYDDGDETRYVDELGTADAAESFHMLEQHVYEDGLHGIVKVVHVDNNFTQARIVKE